MKMTGVFQADLDKYYRIELGDPRPSLRRKLKLWITHLGLHCVAAYRLSVFCREQLRRGNLVALPLALLGEAMCHAARFIHHVDVFAASIGPGFYIGHVGTIYLGRTSVGSNFSVSHNVTVGVGVSEGAHGLPVIGDDVWVGTGSILYGKILVGNGVTVNCGSVLSRSVPDCCLVGGNPARAILKNHDNSELFRHHEAAPLESAAPEESAVPVGSGVPEAGRTGLRAAAADHMDILRQ